MTSNQRRPGFRLPWSSEDGAESPGDAAGADAAPEAATAATAATATTGSPWPAAGVVTEAKDDTATEPAKAKAGDANGSAAPPAKDPAEAAAAPGRTRSQPAPVAATTPAAPEASAGFMRDLVEAMRRVAEETRQSGLSELRTKTEEHVRTLEADADRRREDLRTRAEADIAGVGEWERAEAERIKQEAEQRVVGRRAHLDQQLAAETSRAEAEAKALRDRVAEYERELDAYHAQLSDIADPAAFAAAAKRMPPPPLLTPPAVPAAVAASVADAPDAAKPVDEAAPAKPAEGTDGDGAAAGVHPAEEEVLASRLAELDATLDAAPATDAPAEAGDATSTATEIFVKGLGSFGAITGFRQALAAADGIEGVSLSLGPTGEFVFRAIHGAGFDIAGAIKSLEGDSAKIEPQPDGGLRVTLERSR